MNPVIPNVIVFGETGVGKSSVVNMLARKELAMVSSGAKGCTFDNTAYEITLDGQKFNVYDTVGLNEGENQGRNEGGKEGKDKGNGTYERKDVIYGLYSLIRRLEHSLNLLVFCMRAPRITESTIRNYKLFFEVLCRKKVPIVIVITGLENEVNMDSWWGANKETFERNGMHFEDHACVTATPGKHNVFEEEYCESSEKVQKMIKKRGLGATWKADGNLFVTTTWRIFNKFALVFGWTLKGVSATLYHILRTYFSMSEDEARRAAVRDAPTSTRGVRCDDDH